MNKGDVAYFDLGNPPGGSGREQAGTRPAIIISGGSTDRGNPMVTVVPLTTNSTTTKFPHTQLITSSKDNGLSTDSVALIFQIRSLDKRRIKNIVGKLSPKNLKRVEQHLSTLLSL